jgi:hypothetical protein
MIGKRTIWGLRVAVWLVDADLIATILEETNS